jgi:hypothetical protein
MVEMLLFIEKYSSIFKTCIYYYVTLARVIACHQIFSALMESAFMFVYVHAPDMNLFSWIVYT